MTLSERIHEYLHEWYTSLPVTAIAEAHGVDYNQIRWNELEQFRDDWYELELTEKLEIHDRLQDKYKEFTKQIKSIWER
jgi:hypothetical protein